jgi:hypothetical protein
VFIGTVHPFDEVKERSPAVGPSRRSDRCQTKVDRSCDCATTLSETAKSLIGGLVPHLRNQPDISLQRLLRPMRVQLRAQGRHGSHRRDGKAELLCCPHMADLAIEVLHAWRTEEFFKPGRMSVEGGRSASCVSAPSVRLAKFGFHLRAALERLAQVERSSNGSAANQAIEAR